MNTDSELIALLLPGRKRRGRSGLWRNRSQGAQRLVRSPDGRVALEDVESEEEFDRTARITGCFQQGTPIRDPRTRKVIGYELEEVSFLSAAAS